MPSIDGVSLPSEHALTQRAVARAYEWLSFGGAVALSAMFVAVVHLAVPPAGQTAVLVWLADWLTNLSTHVGDFARAQQPRTLRFDLSLLVVTTFFVRVIVGFSPISTRLQRYAGWLASAGLHGRNKRLIDRSEFSPHAGDQFFVARDEVLATLLGLAEDDRPYGVVVLWGPNGIGKTRVALAWVAQLGGRRRTVLKLRRLGWRRNWHPARWRGRKWDAGFLDVDDIAELRRLGLASWQPLQPTAVVLDATELASDVWRDAEAALRRGAEEYLFPVRVLVLAYQPHSFETHVLAGRTTAETSLPLGPLDAGGARDVYARATAGGILRESDAATLMEVTGGVPILVRMMAGQPNWFDTHQPDGTAAVGATDVLDRYTGKLISTCGTVPLGAETGSQSWSLLEGLAVATLAQRLDISGLKGFSRDSLPAHPAIRMDHDTLLGVEPPLLALAFLFHAHRNTNEATRAAIASRAWRESPHGVGSMTRHFWGSIARVERFASTTDEGPGFNDPAWMRLYSRAPEHTDAATMAAWLATCLDLLRAAQLAPEDRLELERDVADAVESVRSGQAPAELVAPVLRFWSDRVRDGDLGAWASLDALHEDAAVSRDDIRGAWLGAAPNAVYRLVGEQEAVALFDRLLAEALEQEPASWIAAAWAAVTLSARDNRAHATARLTDHAAEAFRLMPPHLLDRQDGSTARAAFLANAIESYGEAQRWNEMDAAERTLAAVAARFVDNADIQLLLAWGAVNAINRHGEGKRWNEMDAAERTLAAVAARFVGNADIQLWLARGAVNAISWHGEGQRWTEMDAAERTLGAVAARFVDNTDIQLWLAQGAVNAISRHGEGQRWTEMDAAERTLAAVAARFVDNADIQLQLAQGAVNAISRHGEGKRWKEMDAAERTLAAVAARFVDNADIQLELAKGAVNAISRHGEGKRWNEMDAAERTLAAVAARFVDNADIQLQLAQGAVNAISRHGEGKRWTEMDAAERTLAAVAARFVDNTDIQLLLAKGAVNAINRHGEGKRWTEMDAAERTLAAVAARFVDNADIQFELAKGAVNAIGRHGEGKRWKEMDAAERTLGAVAARFVDNTDIQLWLAQGAVNAINRHGEGQRWTEMDAAERTLAAVAARFVDNADIQLQLARGAVNAISRHGEGKRWNEMDAAERTLAAVAARFVDNTDIQLWLAQGAGNAIAGHGEGKRWKEMDAAGRTLDAVAARFVDDTDIQLQLARGGHNAVLLSQNADMRRHGREQIATASRRCPTDARIQALAHEHGSSFADQQMRIADQVRQHTMRPGP